MAAAAPSLKLPLSLASLWLLTVSLSLLAVPLLLAAVPHWHTVRGYLEALGLVQAWISIAACLGLLVISRRKHAEHEEAWAHGALLIYVMGGLLTAILLNYGVLPQWLVRSASMVLTAQVLAIMLLHWCFAWLTLRSLLKFRKQT